jgi:hypothetical protein
MCKVSDFMVPVQTRWHKYQVWVYPCQVLVVMGTVAQVLGMCMSLDWYLYNHSGTSTRCGYNTGPVMSSYWSLYEFRV